MSSPQRLSLVIPSDERAGGRLQQLIQQNGFTVVIRKPAVLETLIAA